MFITRYCTSKSKRRLRKVKTCFRTLIERTGRMVEIAREFCEFARQRGDIDLQGVAAELKGFLPAEVVKAVRAKLAAGS